MIEIKNDLKTSEEWQKLCNIQVLDPDGWDRKNYQFSWFEEKITREEFQNRFYGSTVVGDLNGCWWKDKE
jgi:hypothetical protein